MIDKTSDETMMFSFGAEENKAENILQSVCGAMEEKGYNPINQLVGYLISGDPAYVTSHNDARNTRLLKEAVFVTAIRIDALTER